LNGSDPCLWGLRQVEEKAPPDPHRAVYSGVGVELYRFQMRGLGTISSPRRSDRGPDSSLKRLWILV